MHLSNTRCTRSLRLSWMLYNNPGRLERTLAFLAPYRALFHEVALFFEYGHGFFPVAELVPRLPLIRSALGRFAGELGWTTGINVLGTIGHFGEAPDFYPRMTVPPVVDCDGTASDLVACPRQPALVAETQNRYRLLAEQGPSFIWVDDDIKWTYLGKLKAGGCFCPHCLAEFGKACGKPVERAALVAEIRKDTWPEPNPTRRAWMEFSAESFRLLLAAIERSVHGVGPDIELGFMGACDGTGYSGTDFRRLVETLAAQAPNLRIRPGGGFYFDDWPGELVKKSFAVGRIIVSAGPRATAIQAEIENFPYYPLLKTTQATMLESFADVAAGCTGLAFNILPYLNDEEQAIPLLDKLLQASPLLDRFREDANGLPLHGLRVVRAEDHLTRARYADWPQYPPIAANGGALWAPHTLTELGLPFAFDPRFSVANILTEPAVTGLARDELQELLAGPLIADAGAVERLGELGLGELVGVSVGKQYRNGTVERLTDHPLNAGVAGQLRDARNGFFSGSGWTLNLAAGAEVIAEHVRQQTHEPIGPCAAIYRNRLGGRIVSLAYTPWALTHSVAKHRQWRTILAWLGQGKPLAWIEEPFRVVPYVRSDGRKWLVLLINVSMETTTPLRLRVCPAVNSARLLLDAEHERPLPVIPAAAASLVELPAMGPWSLHIVSASLTRWSAVLPLVSHAATRV